MTTLSQSDAEAYLRRLKLDPVLVQQSASLELLSTILLAHHEQVPKDTSPLHVPESHWTGSYPIVLGSSFQQMPLGSLAFSRIVDENKGAFCFALNPVFASLLRVWGFRVSELVARCYQCLGQDPRVHEESWKWGTLSHEVLVCDWEGSQERYLVDVGFGGGGCPVPSVSSLLHLTIRADSRLRCRIPLHHGATVAGLNPYEAYQLLYEDLPLPPTTPRPIDSQKGWTFYRRVSPSTPVILPLPDSAVGYWTPLFHFHLLSVNAIDFSLYHHYSSSHPAAAFTAFFLVTKLLPGTGGARRSLMYSGKPGANREREGFAKIHTTGGLAAEGREGKGADRDVGWIKMHTVSMRKHLVEEFGFKFPEEIRN